MRHGEENMLHQQTKRLIASLSHGLTRPSRLEVTVFLSILASTPCLVNCPQSRLAEQDRSCCVITVATKLRLQMASLNFQPLLGSVSRHGIGYCTFAQPATGTLGFHKHFPAMSASSHRHLSTTLACHASKAHNTPKDHSKVSTGRAAGVRPSPSHVVGATPCC